ncbi:MAG: transglutaminase family protein, partial [Vulcanimicrobiota bacterium]
MEETRKTGFRARDLGAALVWALAWTVLAAELSVPTALGAAAIGGAAGFYLGGWLSRTRLRTPAVLIGWPILLWLVMWAGRLPSTSELLAHTMGSEASFSVAALLIWLLASLSGTGYLRFVSARYPTWVALEVAVVTCFLAVPFAAHRDGFINRPHFLVDPLWSRGYDPMPFLFALGAITGAVVIMLTIGRVTRRSSILDLTLLFVVVGLLFLYLPERSIRDWIPEPPGGLGLTGKAKDPTDGQGKGKPNQGEGQGGQSDDNEIPFQDNYESESEPKPVAVVILRQDYEPPYGYYYFRQSAYSQFNGTRLVADTTGLADRDIAPFFPVGKTKIDIPAPDQGTHQALKTRVALIASHTNPFGLVNAFSMEPAPNPNPEQFQRAYDVDSWVLTADFQALIGRHLGNPKWDERLLKHYTEIPDDPRYQELAHKIIAQLPEEYREDPLAWAVAVKLYLDKNGTYSLKSNHMSSVDPVADFLFGDMTGYCVHFAHAACYLYRSVGIPSRVGAGYATDARFRGSGSAILLRDREAHAWPEVYFEGLGWVILDISPENSTVPMMSQPDPDLAKLLGELARDEDETVDDNPQKSLRELLREWAELVAVVAGWGCLLGLVGLYAGKLYRRLAPRYCSDAKAPQLYYRAALDGMAEAGLWRGYGQGRLNFAEQHCQTIPALGELTILQQQQALGGPNHQPTVRGADIHKLYAQFGRQLAHTGPRWRRLLG